MFDKSYFEKEFPKQIEQFKKSSKQAPKIILVLGGNHHIELHEIEDIKDGWFSCWVEDSDFKSEKKPTVLMICRYDQVREILLYPSKSETSTGFRRP
jgi:hypothetical protein